MSGIVGMLNLDGSPVDGGLLGRMTAYLRFRGPDGQRAWAMKNVGFGHALLRVTEESAREAQPFTLDGQRWIVADARVDARQDLIAELRARGQQDVAFDAPDVELILRAYGVWGEDCVSHLLGDFTFAVWDEPRQRLFCARDHLGVKPFFYAQLGQTVRLQQHARLHPPASGGVARLNDAAIADFLLFGANQESDTTSFRDIRRLPPAHCHHLVEWHATQCRRYWTLPVEEPIHFKRADEYIGPVQRAAASRAARSAANAARRRVHERWSGFDDARGTWRSACCASAPATFSSGDHFGVRSADPGCRAALCRSGCGASEHSHSLRREGRRNIDRPLGSGVGPHA